jgi:ubiquinone/menaquinone biosynthesis C-methylase UbiE
MKTSFSKIAPQLRCPNGDFGKEVGKTMDAMNDLQNNWVISLLNLQKDEYILEIGFGTGKTIKKALDYIPQGRIFGIELSDVMFEAASQLLHNEIGRGKVKLCKGNSDKLPFTDNYFDKLYAVHVVYFWNDINSVMSEIFRVSQTGGIAAIYFVSPILEPSPYFHEYSEDEIIISLKNAGFGKVDVRRKKFENQNGICILATK